MNLFQSSLRLCFFAPLRFNPPVDQDLQKRIQAALANPQNLGEMANADAIASLIRAVHQVHVSPAISRYAVDLAQATREHRDIRLGVSPRATLHIVRAAKAAAALAARDYVLPDDIQQLAVPVLAHRLILTADAHIAGRTAESLVSEILARTPVVGT